MLFLHMIRVCFLTFGIVTPGKKEQRVYRAMFFFFQRNTWQLELLLLRCKISRKPGIVTGLRSRGGSMGLAGSAPGMCLGSS